MSIQAERSRARLGLKVGQGRLGWLWRETLRHRICGSRFRKFEDKLGHSHSQEEVRKTFDAEHRTIVVVKYSNRWNSHNLKRKLQLIQVIYMCASKAINLVQKVLQLFAKIAKASASFHSSKATSFYKNDDVTNTNIIIRVNYLHPSELGSLDSRLEMSFGCWECLFEFVKKKWRS